MVSPLMGVLKVFALRVNSTSAWRDSLSLKVQRPKTPFVPVKPGVAVAPSTILEIGVPKQIPAECLATQQSVQQQQQKNIFPHGWILLNDEMTGGQSGSIFFQQEIIGCRCQRSSVKFSHFPTYTVYLHQLSIQAIYFQATLLQGTFP